ncbi:hypothetical protein AVEN_1303-1 [Araneus ventricosus]|uniref:Uncharacterized protein n=1 Tax=Araneus ventricosus TaxID=182803 RepID=A0A4Y2WL69_ARAVE|nr:hypothetical protein AVEN_1303-1 [Araneus ventricosus]
MDLQQSFCEAPNGFIQSLMCVCAKRRLVTHGSTAIIPHSDKTSRISAAVLNILTTTTDQIERKIKGWTYHPSEFVDPMQIFLENGSPSSLTQKDKY